MTSFFLLIAVAFCVRFDVESSAQHSEKFHCLDMYIGSHQLVIGAIGVGEAYHMKTIAKVTDSNGNIFWFCPNVRHLMRYSFKTGEDSMDYSFCFANVVDPGYSASETLKREIILTADTRNDLFDEKLAYKKRIRPLEREIERLELDIAEIAQSMEEGLQKEMTLRDRNELINDRVMHLSILGIVVLVAFGAGQLIYLKRFFKSKKLI